MWWKKSKNISFIFEVDKDGNFFLKCNWPDTNNVDYKDLISLIEHANNVLNLLTSGGLNEHIGSVIMSSAKKTNKKVDEGIAMSLINEFNKANIQNQLITNSPVVPATEVF